MISLSNSTSLISYFLHFEIQPKILVEDQPITAKIKKYNTTKIVNSKAASVRSPIIEAPAYMLVTTVKLSTDLLITSYLILLNDLCADET